MGGDDGVKTCDNRVELRGLFRQWAEAPTAKRKEGDGWTAYSSEFRLMDGRNYTLQVLNYPNNFYGAKLFNDRGMESGRITATGLFCTLSGTFQRSLDVLLMEQALELATGKIIPVR